MNPGALFSKLKNPKKINVSKTKTKTGKAINLKIYLLFYGQKYMFNLGIPLILNYDIICLMQRGPALLGGRID